ncbi:MAG: zinc ribbon domain-containing protein [Gammaproteobacteria bacterium]|nr:zinc ribbon domain-containing protein [Gammaproteobacteria bacterium]MCW8959627.1 zinc ribbon domain-containing protein [Gammaproteobacteria bacterium]MCW8972784.1 zinc ribbon domain-containing protein [Gammaproteobacteria bacterium]MCW8994101.1 zinc ribbon domain-containing protein [Gammaproteobacteria bacterium]
MPFYEYRCEICGHRVEVMQKMSDAPLVECPQCHAEQLRKLVSAGSFGSKAASIDNAPACASGGCGASCMTQS